MPPDEVVFARRWWIFGYTDLDASYTPLLDAGLREWCQEINNRRNRRSRIRSIDLGGNQITAVGAKLLSQLLKSLKHLQALDLRHNGLRTAGIRALITDTTTTEEEVADADSSGFPPGKCTGGLAFALRHHLRHLDVSVNTIKDDGLLVLAPCVASSRNLTFLELTDSQLTADAGEILADILRCSSSLQILKLGFNHLCDRGVIALVEALKENSVLQQLDISDNEVGDDGASAIAALLQAPAEETVTTNGLLRSVVTWLHKKGKGSVRGGSGLTFLNLSVNKIGSSGACELANALKTNRSLQILDLGCNPFEEEGVLALIHSLRSNTTLVDLDMTSCRLTNRCGDAIIHALLVNRSLAKLSLYCNDDLDEWHEAEIHRLLSAHQLETKIGEKRDRWAFQAKTTIYLSTAMIMTVVLAAVLGKKFV